MRISKEKKQTKCPPWKNKEMEKKRENPEKKTKLWKKSEFIGEIRKTEKGKMGKDMEEK